MRTAELTRAQAREAMKVWLDGGNQLPPIDPEWLSMRSALQNYYKTLSQDSEHDGNSYYLDVHMGLFLFEFLQQKKFTMRQASNDGMWRFFSLKVVPDLVGRRWGNDAEEHYWKRPSRNWLRSLWWYVYLSWQGDIASTESVLASPNFNTDTILNLEERTGRKGTYVDVYRLIMYYYSTIPSEELKAINQAIHKSDSRSNLFRVVMKLNTAVSLSIEPSLYLGGPVEYVKGLFRAAGIGSR